MAIDIKTILSTAAPIGFTGSAGPSTAINATDDTSASTHYPVFVAAAGSNQTPRIRTTSTSFSFVPSTGTLTANTLNVSLGTVTAPSYSFIGDPNTGIWSPAADTIAFSEGGVEVMRITSAGNVGIGTSSPNAKLHVEGGSIRTNGSYIVSGAGELKTSLAGSGIAINTTSVNGIAFETGGAEHMRVTSTGNVGIGTSSPGFPLEVNGEVRASNFTTLSGSITANNATDYTILTLSGVSVRNYIVTIGLPGGQNSACSLILAGGDGGGNIDLRKVDLAAPTSAFSLSINVSGGNIRVRQDTGAPTQPIDWAITRIM